MQAVHNASSSQIVAVLLTLILETLFAFLGGWTLYDTFESWGFFPALIIGGLVGATLFLLYLYVFIFREYALDAVAVFSARRHENGSRASWASFLALACILMDSFFNADRMVNLPHLTVASKLFIWLGLQILVFVPFALGKIVHAHINTIDLTAQRTIQISQDVDKELLDRLATLLPTLNAVELLALKQGDTTPIQNRLQAIEAEKAAQQQTTNPLDTALALLLSGQTNQKQTGPIQAQKAK